MTTLARVIHEAAVTAALALLLAGCATPSGRRPGRPLGCVFEHHFAHRAEAT